MCHAPVHAPARTVPHAQVRRVLHGPQGSPAPDPWLSTGWRRWCSAGVRRVVRFPAPGRCGGTAMRTRLLAVAAASVLLLTGCGGNPEPKSLPSESASPSASASASRDSSGAAERRVSTHTRTGADAFVRHYVEMLNFAGASGTTERPAEQLSLQTCVKCDALADGIDKIYRAGGRHRGRRLDRRGHQVISVTAKASTLLDATVDYCAATSLTPAQGQSPQPFPGAKQSSPSLLCLNGEGWSWRVGALDPTHDPHAATLTSVAGPRDVSDRRGGGPDRTSVRRRCLRRDLE